MALALTSAAAVNGGKVSPAMVRILASVFSMVAKSLNSLSAAIADRPCGCRIHGVTIGDRARVFVPVLISAFNPSTDFLNCSADLARFGLRLK